MSVKVILRADVGNLGRKGEVLDVADGYARNYLVPRGLALVATKGVLDQAATMRAARDRRAGRDREAAEELAGRLRSSVIRIPARAGADGRLFGSVTAADIADAVGAQAGVELDRRRMHLGEPIRALGRQEVSVRLHPEVEVALAVEVTPEG